MSDINKCYLERLNKSAMIMIDHQTGSMLDVQDICLDQFRRNVLAFAGGQTA